MILTGLTPARAGESFSLVRIRSTDLHHRMPVQDCQRALSFRESPAELDPEETFGIVVAERLPMPLADLYPRSSPDVNRIVKRQKPCFCELFGVSCSEDPSTIHLIYIQIKALHLEFNNF